MGWNRSWRPYVPVSQRRAEARRAVAAFRKQGVDIQPVEIEGRKIATTFWGEAWCDHLESFGDYANRLPRGRTYVRNGSVCHLDVTAGKVDALVSGSELYHVEISIKRLAAKTWAAVRKRCAGRIGSLLELLQGNLSDRVMEVVTDRKAGLFPQPREITFDCDCPDWADMCKHVAAVCYGVGARLDVRPELLFLLRGVDQQDLIAADAEQAVAAATTRGRSKRLADDDLGDVFGIDLDDDPPAAPRTRARTPRKAAKRKKAYPSKKTDAKKKVVSKKRIAPKKKAAANKKVSAKKKAAPRKKVVKRKVVKRKVAKQKGTAKKKTPSKKKVVMTKAVVKKKAATGKTAGAKRKTPAKKKATAGKKTAKRKVPTRRAPVAKTAAAKKKKTTRRKKAVGGKKPPAKRRAKR